VPPGDAKALARAIKTLLDDFPRAKAMGEAGRDRVERLFTWRECARKTEALYRELLGCAGRQSA
jgi:glycosyltransferase involved in cell wall biosynthesis